MRLTTLKTAWKQASGHQAPLLAAGVAFYAFTSLFPALIAAISLYGIVAEPETVAAQSERIRELLPSDAASIVTDQIDQITRTSADALGLTGAIALLIALYSASGGVGNLLTAVNLMYGLRDDRNFVKRKALSAAMTLVMVVFALLAVTLIAVAPAVFSVVDVVPGVRLMAEGARWVVLVCLVVGVIAMLYRVAPNRAGRTRLLSRGVLVAAALWIAVSVGFSVYVDNFGSYGRTYGALAGVIVLLLWLWIGVFAVLFGAALQAVTEDIVSPATLAEDASIAQRRTDALRDTP